MPDDVAARLQRVDERLRDCYTQQTRLVEDITALQKKRQFLQSLGEPIDLPGQRPKSPPVTQPRPSPPSTATDRNADRPAERIADRPADQSIVEPVASEPSPPQPPAPPSNIDALILNARTQVSQLLQDSRMFATKAQDIVGVLTAINNVLVLAGPEGRPRLTDLGRNLVGMLNGMVQEVPGASPEPLSPSAAGTRQGASFFPQLLTLLQSPIVEAMLNTLTAVPKVPNLG